MVTTWYVQQGIDLNKLRYDVLSNVSIWLPHDIFNKVINSLQCDVLGNIWTYVWRQLGDGFLCDASVSTHVSHANHVLLIQRMTLQFCNMSSKLLYHICLYLGKIRIHTLRANRCMKVSRLNYKMFNSYAHTVAIKKVWKGTMLFVNI